MADPRRTRAWRRAVLAMQAEVRLAAQRGQPLACIRCGRPVLPEHRPDLGHVVDVARGGTAAHGTGPEHQACNRAAGARLGNGMRGGGPSSDIAL